jgi:hypothetical protein
MIHRGMTEEEKVAVKISNMICDLRLDIERVGIYLARMRPSTTFHRLEIMTESAQEERDNNGFTTINYRVSR